MKLCQPQKHLEYNCDKNHVKMEEIDIESQDRRNNRHQVSTIQCRMLDAEFVSINSQATTTNMNEFVSLTKYCNEQQKHKFQIKQTTKTTTNHHVCNNNQQQRTIDIPFRIFEIGTTNEICETTNDFVRRSETEIESRKVEARNNHRQFEKR